MNSPGPGTREVMLGLVESLLPSLPHDASAIAQLAARDVALLLGLPGLDAVLAEIGRHPGADRPLELEHVAQRLERLAAAAVREGDLTPFTQADAELATLAASLATTDWSALPRGRAVATITVAEALSDLSLDAPADARSARLTMTVASAVRASLDWLGVDEHGRVTAETNDSALTFTAAVGHEGGIGPAGAVLASVEGSLGRVHEGRWTLRVPRCTERPSFLLVRQGRYGLALPWHSVARLRMFAPHELERLEEPTLDPLVKRHPVTTEQPAALVALGLARAWLVADRIVWRIAARPEEADTAAPFAGVSLSIDVESGERYWVLEPGWLLRGIVPPDVAPPSPRPRASVSAMPVPADVSAPAVLATEPSPESMAEAVEHALLLLRGERAAAESVSASARASAAPAFAPVPQGPAPPAVVDAALDVLFSGAPAWPAADAAGSGAEDSGVFPAPAGLAPADSGSAADHTASDTLADAVDAALSFPEAAGASPAETSASLAPEDAVLEAPAPAAPEDVVFFEPAPTTFPAAPEDVVFREPAPATFPAAPEDVVFFESAPATFPAAPEDVVFFEPTPATVPAAPEDAVFFELAPATVPAPQPALRRALVADDSLVARIFLARLLEKRGWIVECVPDASALFAEISRSEWEMVCADIALPDAQGAGHVRRLIAALSGCGTPPRLVVLTRDAEDERVAREAGAALVLRKPFEPEKLDDLLPR